MKKVSKKIVLLGNESVGKTSLVKKYVHSIFNDEYLTTIGIKISKKVVIVDDIEVNLMLWDIAGNMMSKLLYDNYLNGAHGIFLVCDGTRLETYDSIQEEKENHLSIDFANVSLITLVNKADLLDEKEQQKIKMLNYDFLTSAKTGLNVDEAFQKMASEIIKQK
jgi:small GTP-binding protein